MDTCDQSFYARASRTASWGALAKLDSHFLLSLRCFNSFYYVMILLLFWGHEPCIGFFFLLRFNTPDALICYPGSIEKLKLLGATYLLIYFSEFWARTWYRRQIIVGLDRMDWTWSGVTSGALVHSISCGCGHKSTCECAPGFHWAPGSGGTCESQQHRERAWTCFWRPVFSHPWMLLEVLIH